jgi:GH24 family phage-related lysozyme (muramidase)
MLSNTHALSGNGNQAIRDTLFSEFIERREGFEEDGDGALPYFDTVNVPTIGYGVNLQESAYRNYVFTEMGITNANHRQQYINIWNDERNLLVQDIANIPSNVTGQARTYRINDLRGTHTANMQTRLNELYRQLNPNAAADATFSIERDQARSVFNTITDTKITELDNKLKIGQTNALINKYSLEYVALLDMVYNGGTGLIGNSLSSALSADNRAEAWYQIRYNSNGGTSRSKGLANRRVAESNIFNLYSSTFSNVNNEANTL